MSERGKIAVLMTCYNRVATTLECLKCLMPQLGGGDKVYLVDDGSTDGTGASVRAAYPGVRVVEGDGALYWAKGMRLAWESAIESGSKYDFFLWLNDDVMLKSDAIRNLLGDYSCAQGQPYAVVVGTCSQDESEDASSYGATDRRDVRYEPNGCSPKVATGWFNGNVVLVPYAAYDKVGMISGDYSHSRSDYDYAERLKHAKVPFYASSHFVGVCRRGAVKSLDGKGLTERVRSLFRPGNTNIRDLWLYRRRYFGGFRACVSCLYLVKQVLFGGHESTHRARMRLELLNQKA